MMRAVATETMQVIFRRILKPSWSWNAWPGAAPGSHSRLRRPVLPAFRAPPAPVTSSCGSPRIAGA